jgi:hypothetical protein
VAEHQPANEQAYQQYLQNAYDLCPWGLLLCLLPMQVRRTRHRGHAMLWDVGTCHY